MTTTAATTTTTTSGARPAPPLAPAGLRGVVVTETRLGDVLGQEGSYHYRGYSGVELARTRDVEDGWFLLHRGHLPSADEHAGFAAEVRGARALGPAVLAALPGIAAAGAAAAPLTGLRTALSLLAAEEGMRPVLDLGPEQRARDALRLCAATPTVLAALHRLRAGLAPVAPRADLGTAANWLWMLAGREADARHVRAVERYLVATLDHGFNASTFTARVVASTGADVAAAVVAALGAFSGPLHGGAPDRALAALDDIGSPDRLDAWVRARVAAGERIMGFGHAVYRTADPRAVLLRETAQELGGDLVDFATAVERRVVEVLAELKPGRELHANVEFYAGVVMELCGLERVLFTPTFAVSRVVGWCANVLEQAGEGRVVRPAARYAGPPPRPVPPRG
ncbi:citrate/2-methylcitrate synthase [Kineococcus rubinsiae]|uniref:citrate/2-methylcitrate synthase n=1 Tax=Kineococcus rubinsiae TaxID=2609562 RepID=UPI00143227E1|nr:citrate/2-methylcitrate synthase [Kineococcus rubinsiae]NIZ92259.1 citrate synthase/methylcitrate synthase [Kineococcus rubinsiae]